MPQVGVPIAPKGPKDVQLDSLQTPHGRTWHGTRERFRQSHHAPTPEKHGPLTPNHPRAAAPSPEGSIMRGSIIEWRRIHCDYIT